MSKLYCYFYNDIDENPTPEKYSVFLLITIPQNGKKDVVMGLWLCK